MKNSYFEYQAKIITDELLTSSYGIIKSITPDSDAQKIVVIFRNVKDQGMTDIIQLMHYPKSFGFDIDTNTNGHVILTQHAKPDEFLNKILDLSDVSELSDAYTMEHALNTIHKLIYTKIINTLKR